MTFAIIGIGDVVAFGEGVARGTPVASITASLIGDQIRRTGGCGKGKHERDNSHRLQKHSVITTHRDLPRMLQNGSRT